MRNHRISSLVASLVLVTFFAPLQAADNDPALNAQVQELMKRIEQQDQRIQQQEQRIQELRKEQETKYVEGIHKDELRKVMKEIMDDAQSQPAMPKWLENLTFYGDFRLRFQHVSENSRFTSTGSTPKNDNRLRYRLRFGFTKTWWEKQMEVGFRLATASSQTNGYSSQPEGNPRNWNVDMDGNFSKKPIWVDLAYVKYKPDWLKGATLTVGKMLNPIKTATSLVWEPTITPEGAHLVYEAPFWGDFKPYAEFGWWNLQVNANRNIAAVNQVGQENSNRDVQLWTLGGGFSWKINKDVQMYLGATYYDFIHYNYVLRDYHGPDGTWGRPDMGMLELTSKVNWRMFDLPMSAWMSWVHNCKDNYEGTDRDLKDKNNGLGVGIKVGNNKKKGDWSVAYSYMYIEANSEPAIFSDALFGGPNREGHIIQGLYNIDDFLTLGANLYLTEPISSYSTESGRDFRTLLQVEMVWSF